MTSRGIPFFLLAATESSPRRAIVSHSTQISLRNQTALGTHPPGQRAISMC